ncbi:unnamed protein product [Bursaphelenchus okinawaensis]|uniref:Cell cycle control protein 50A n=1 Tax=Bursaphelenchus okinawaensis TaxID=465554 RepID=A0A811KTN3_9BILA|nr:unnamed protein product [Bursaphelenchus okinawaensis]CAG9111126.1 unnamed protein product [Bursaphelenchus okinawaensis]
MPDELPRIPKKRRPRNKPRSDAWLQQNLNAYRPSFTFRCALPVIASTAAVCWGMGITLIYNNSKAIEHEIDYTDCSNGGDLWQTKVEDSKKICTHEFHLEQEYKGDVTFYYGLDGFYQNIRKYHQSRNDHQLRSHDLRATEDCYPYEHSKVNGRELPIVPCGAVANSMFNDTFTLYRVIDGNHVKVDWTALDIVDPRFREKKYKNPKTCRGNITTCPGFENTAKPEDWTRHIAEIGDVETGRALENADFIIWMETSALPNFRKVYRKLRVLPANENKDGLNVGRYVLEIVDTERASNGFVRLQTSNNK